MRSELKRADGSTDLTAFSVSVAVSSGMDVCFSDRRRLTIRSIGPGPSNPIMCWHLGENCSDNGCGMGFRSGLFFGSDTTPSSVGVSTFLLTYALVADLVTVARP